MPTRVEADLSGIKIDYMNMSWERSARTGFRKCHEVLPHYQIAKGLNHVIFEKIKYSFWNLVHVRSTVISVALDNSRVKLRVRFIDNLDSLLSW